MIIIFVSPFYFKNYYLYKKFAISLTPFEHLSQKIDFIKEIKQNYSISLITNNDTNQIIFTKNIKNLDKINIKTELDRQIYDLVQ